MSDSSMMAQSQPPMKNCQPYIVLWKCGSIDIERSQDRITQPKPNTSARTTASFPCSECVECSSRRSSPKPARMRARMFFAQFAPHSGRTPTSRRTAV